MDVRIHTNTLTRQDLENAAKVAGVTVVDLSEHGSQSRARAFNFTLSGNSSYRSGWRNSDHRAATWDEWGIVFAELFTADPAMTAGSKAWGYQSAEHFHWVTGNRFRHLHPLAQHKRHKWNPQGAVATGSYAVATCDCGAVQRWMLPGHTWEEIAS